MWVCELGFWLLLLGVTYLFVVYFVSFVGQDGASTISSCHGMLLCLVAERRELHVEGGGGEGGSVREGERQGGAGRYVGRGSKGERVKLSKISFLSLVIIGLETVIGAAAVTGFVVAVLLAVLVTSIFICCYLKKRRNKKYSKSHPSEYLDKTPLGSDKRAYTPT